MQAVINIAGSMPRIGTTTQSLTLCKYLNACGHKAAYFECNTQNYIGALQTMYVDTMPHPHVDYLNFAGIDMYPKERIKEFTDGNGKYEYLICDYGNMLLASFDENNFINGTARIMVGGSKVSELLEMTKLLSRSELYQRLIYIFSFVPAADRDTILEQMAEISAWTLFSPYMPDPLARYEIYDNYFIALMNLVLADKERKARTELKIKR